MNEALFALDQHVTELVGRIINSEIKNQALQEKIVSLEEDLNEAVMQIKHINAWRKTFSGN